MWFLEREEGRVGREFRIETFSIRFTCIHSVRLHNKEVSYLINKEVSYLIPSGIPSGSRWTEGGYFWSLLSISLREERQTGREAFFVLVIICFCFKIDTSSILSLYCFCISNWTRSLSAGVLSKSQQVISGVKVLLAYLWLERNQRVFMKSVFRGFMFWSSKVQDFHLVFSLSLSFFFHLKRKQASLLIFSTSCPLSKYFRIFPFKILFWKSFYLSDWRVFASYY